MVFLILQDTEAVIWDVIAEKGLHRLSGHKGVVTGVQFINKHNLVMTSSKDTYIKFWDLTTGHCFKTLAGHITEVRFIYEYKNIIMYCYFSWCYFVKIYIIYKNFLKRY